MFSKCFRVLRHAALMVGRTIKSYAMLSVTITLSFSLLLGYLIYTDSVLYNKHKITLAKDPNYAITAEMDQNPRYAALLEKALTMEDTYGYVLQSTIVDPLGTLTFAEDGGTLLYPYMYIYSLPDNVFGIPAQFDELAQVDWLPGQERETITLKGNETIMDSVWFHALGLDQMEEPVYTLRFGSEANGQKNQTLELRIVGTFERKSVTSGEVLTQVNDKENIWRVQWNPIICVSQSYFGPNNAPEGYEWYARSVYYTLRPYELMAVAKNILGTDYDNGGFYCAAEYRDAALQEIRTQNRLKVIIAGAMLLLLGINLYSSFINALSSRKFEIGVKRAIGASAWSIVRQFLYEGLLVMAANILLSISLVTTAAIILKDVKEYLRYIEGDVGRFTIYFSPFSIAMFAVCAVSLTLVFSLIFAYKSTQVQIVDYLKAE